MKLKLGVMFGGTSVEHEVSIISALLAIENIDREKYEVIPIYITKNKELYTSRKFLNIENFKNIDDAIKGAYKVDIEVKNNNIYLRQNKFFMPRTFDVDIFYPIVHGSGIEDGTIQGYLEFKGVPYVGSNVLSSAIGQDKAIFKNICMANGISVLDYKVFYDFELENTKYIEDEVAKLSFPVIIKPSTLGSSVGISIATSKEEVISKISEAFKFDYKVIVERKITSLREINVSLLGDEKEVSISSMEEIVTPNEYYTYDDKYKSDRKGMKTSKSSNKRIIPAKIDESLENEIKDISKKIFKVSGFSGIVRFDFLIDKENSKVYFNEPNTIPGSLSVHLWNGSGVKFTEILNKSIDVAINNYKRKEGKIKSFDTNILSFRGGKNLKGKLK